MAGALGIGDNTPLTSNRNPLIGNKNKKGPTKDKILINPSVPDGNDPKKTTSEATIAAASIRDNNEQAALVEKAAASKIPLKIIEQVYERGISRWFDQADRSHSAQQYAFSRVASFINGGKAWNEDVDLHEAATPKPAKPPKLKPEQLIPGQTCVRTLRGGYKGKVTKIYRHPQMEYAIHFKTEHGKSYRTGIENLMIESVSAVPKDLKNRDEIIQRIRRYKDYNRIQLTIGEEAPGADLERRRLLRLHKILKARFPGQKKDDQGNVVKEGTESFFTVRDRAGVVHYIGRDYKEAHKIRARYKQSRVHRHHHNGMGVEDE